MRRIDMALFDFHQMRLKFSLANLASRAEKKVDCEILFSNVRLL